MNEFGMELPNVIGLTILHSLWQVTLLWIILVAVLRLWRRASSAIRYTLAISTLVLTVLTTAGTAFYEWRSHTSVGEGNMVSSETSQSLGSSLTTAMKTLPSGVDIVTNAAVPILGWLWCAGLVVMGTRFGGSIFYLKELRSHENIEEISPAWEQKLNHLSNALGLRREVSIAMSGRISSPVTLGYISPIVLLPAGLMSGLSTSQMEAILVHELYHIKRCDFIVNIGQALVEVALFYHPAVWHINKIIREERENCCDDQTVAFCGDPLAYARALTHLQEISIIAKPALTLSATGPKTGKFTNRIKRILDIHPNPTQAKSKGIFAIGILIVYLAILFTTATISTAQQVKPNKWTLSKSVEEQNLFSNIFGDSIPVNEHLYLLNGEEITPQQLSSVTDIRSIDIQRADTMVIEGSLDKCLRQVNLLIKMVSIRGSGDSSGSTRFLIPDSMEIDRSINHTVFPTRFSQTLNRPRTLRTDSLNMDSDAMTSTDAMSEGGEVQVFPNAADTFVNIIFTPSRGDSRVTLALADTDGKVVKEITDGIYDNVQTELRIDVSNLTKGVYILRIIIDGEKSHRRIVVE